MYIGPETLMPLASILAGIAGAALIFWKRTIETARSGRDALVRLVSRLTDRT